MNLSPQTLDDSDRVEVFARYLDGTLSPQELDWLDQELRSNSACRAQFQDYCLQVTILEQATSSPVHSANPVRFPVAWVYPMAALLVALMALLFQTDPSVAPPAEGIAESSESSFDANLRPVYATWDRYDPRGLGLLSPQTIALLLTAGAQPTESPWSSNWVLSALADQRPEHPPQFVAVADRFWSVPPEEIDWTRFSFLQTTTSPIPPSL